MSRRGIAAGGLLTALLSLAVWIVGCPGPAPKKLEGKAGGPLAAKVAISGHLEVMVEADGSLTPFFIYPKRPVKLCFDSELDATSWQVWATFEGKTESTWTQMEAGAQLGDVTCFVTPLPKEHDPTVPLQFCWQVYDSYEQIRFDQECDTVRYAPEDSAFQELRARGTQLNQSAESKPEEYLELAQVAETRGYPSYGVGLRFIAVERLWRNGQLEQVRQQLEALPSWLEKPEASALAARAERHRATLDLAESNLQSAWRHLESADLLMRSIVPEWRVAVANEQAKILRRVGSLQEAIERLEEALDGCTTTSPCTPLLENSAKIHLYWLRILRLDSSPEELAEVERDIEAVLPEYLQDPNLYEGEGAVAYINLAHLRVLRNRAPASALEEARELLTGAAAQGSPESRVLELRTWTDLVEGLSALANADATRALALCSRGAHLDQFPRLAAWSASCVGRAQRLAGDSAAALLAFEQALTLHEYGSTIDLEQLIDQGPGQRGEDYYRASRAAAETGELEKAIEILEQLDRFSTDEQLRRICRERAHTPEQLAAWEQNAERIAEVFGQLRDKEKTVTGRRKKSVDESVRQLKLRQRELFRELPGCADLLQVSANPGPPPIGWRLAALQDEILLFHRAADGEVTLDRRPIDRRDLRERVALISEALESRKMSDQDWRALTRPLADALIPPHPDGLGAETRFAMHGFLQGAPLAALPLANGGEHRWLADLTTPVLQPALRGVQWPRTPSKGSLHGLFVVDPKNTLASSPQQAEFYRRRSPGAQILRGKAATAEALRFQLTTASFLHLDVHAYFDPVFPELSSIELADGDLTLSALADFPAPPVFANLSGCSTGRWPTTTDAGRFGIAGVFARGGTPWVIASRNVIRDQLLGDFNMVFYQDLATTAVTPQLIPQYYASALRQLRKNYSATEWASLFLLAGRENRPERGQSTTLVTPQQSEAVPLAREKRTFPDSQVRRSSNGHADNAEPTDANTRF